MYPAPQIQSLPTTSLKPSAGNVRTHNGKQIAQLSRAIAEFGFISPIVTDSNFNILAGHARWEAAKKLGLRAVPVLAIGELTDAKRRAFALADNRIAERAGWDRSRLAIELHELSPLLADAGLSIDLTGFEAADIDGLFSDYIDREVDPIDEVAPPADQAVSKPGDLWLLGPHRLLCGDALSKADIRRVMNGQIAAMVITDPPYNVKIKSVVGRGAKKYREFGQASGEMSSAEFTRFLRNAMRVAAEHSAEGSIAFWFIDWRHIGEMLAAGRPVYGPLKNLVVWAKTSPGMGTFYRSQHELVLVFKKGDAAHINNFELGQHGRTRSNLWSYAAANGFKQGSKDDLRGHPTIKPVALIADAIRDVSKRGDFVLDIFCGSGTTILAAERVGRKCAAVERDPLYVDLAIRRWQAFTGKDAALNGTNQIFGEIESSRMVVRDSDDE